MSAKESSDTLLELQEVNERLNSCAQSEDLHMRVDVVFKVWNNQEKFPDRPVRYFDKNVTVVEASRLAFEAYVDNFRGKIYASIAEGNIAIAVGDDNEKLSTFIQNGEQLIVSDVLDYKRRKETRDRNILTLSIILGTVSFIAFIVWVITVLQAKYKKAATLA
ncbi:hypothetical protein EJF18_30305 [Clavispora lusitaniae]|uniref:Uncharacterized protein n=1 Tax=Clavispora lusitaniae TaxID=36911 RepID=A0ACD0WJ20_CLALS|nr:hypothetical protein EJF14_30305 [Clavispora lusitaniae]QFZ33356.1 hypothetical protein EJF16_30305 [Clavispora lusitaniae]QFZ39027.1 hypothetical protein EJF15_30305 [Clavispora lusitaniae]QFZ44709.1 hypothetical protein EJF18_30305 [Clavispora lusitaniae]QFZ50386.1 hypothetical protein EJF17_30305 [Clavispora lusitaniae]